MDRNQTRCSRREGQTLLNKWEDKRQSLSVTMDTWHVVGLHGGQQGMRGGAADWPGAGQASSNQRAARGP